MGIRNTAMVHLMALCGLRPAEVCDLNAGDLYPIDGIVIVRAATGRERWARNVEFPSVIRDGRVTTLPQMAETLLVWLEIRARTFPHLEDDDPLFVTLEPGRTTGADGNSEGGIRSAGQRLNVEAIRLMLKRAAARAGIDPRHVTARRLRHYFGINAAASGVGNLGLMESMGLRSLRMTERYTAGDESDSPPRCGWENMALGVQVVPPRPLRRLTDGPKSNAMGISELARWLFNRE
jgi:integrase